MAQAYSVKIADDILAFIQSDGWRVVKYRLGVAYRDALQYRVNSNIKTGDMNKAQIHLGMIAGVDEAIDITERIVRELRDGKLDADVALSVIENKQRNKEIGYGK